MSTKTVPMACRAAVGGGVARCKNMNCATHGPDAPRAPRPDVLLFKVNLNEDWDKRFEAAGVREHQRTAERGAELAAQHQAQAESIGRNPFAIRSRREPDKLDKPEAADSGCPVFGVQGLLGGVNVTEIVDELEAAGFELTSFLRMKRAWKEGTRGPAARLVLEFRKDKPEAEGFPWELFAELIGNSFSKLDLFANPRDQRGLVVHTINLGGEKKPLNAAAHTVKFADGDWDVA